MTRFVKTYPRAVVRIARPTAARPTWGPAWKVWVIGSSGSAIRDELHRPGEVTISPRRAAIEDAILTVGIARQIYGTTKAGARA